MRCENISDGTYRERNTQREGQKSRGKMDARKRLTKVCACFAKREYHCRHENKASVDLVRAVHCYRHIEIKRGKNYCECRDDRYGSKCSDVFCGFVFRNG